MMSMVVPAQFSILQKSLVNLSTNKSMNIEVIHILCNELNKHGFDDAKRQFMSCLTPVHCTNKKLIISKMRIHYGLVRRKKLNVIKPGSSSSSLDEERCNLFLMNFLALPFLYQTTQLISIGETSMPLTVTALHPQKCQMMIQSLHHHHHQGL